MAIDFGSVFNRGVNASIQNQKPVIDANLESVPGMKKRIDYFGDLFQQGPNEQETADYFNTANANANMRGQAASPAQILQNVLGYQTYKRGVREGASNQLGQITSPFVLNAVQPSQGVQGAMEAEQFNENFANQQTMMDQQQGRGKYGQSDLGKVGSLALGAGMAAATGGMSAMAPGMAGAAGGAGAGALGGVGGGIAGGAMGGAGYTSPFQKRALQLAGFGTGYNVGTNLFK